MNHEKRKDIFDVFTALEQMLEQRHETKTTTPQPQPQPKPQPQRTPQPKARKPNNNPLLQFHSIREFASPHLVRMNKSRAKPQKAPRRRRTPAELHTIQMFFLKWMRRCAERMSQEPRTPRVSFDLGARRATDDDPVSNFNLEETSPLPGTLAPETLSSSDIVDATSFDIHDTPDPSPRGEARVTEFRTSALKKK